MINRSKILNAINEGIKSGFKISSNNVVDDSSSVNFSDSKINNVKSLTLKHVLINSINDAIQNEEIDLVDELLQTYRLHKYDINDINFYRYSPLRKSILKNLIEVLVHRISTTIDLNWIDVSHLSDLSALFYKYMNQYDEYPEGDLTDENAPYHYVQLFNGDISKWDVSNVKYFTHMFTNSYFNGDISKWNMCNAAHMSSMFAESTFNGDISEWNVSNVADMWGMFMQSKFNNDISKWNVSNVKNMAYMFERSQFNKDISKWNVSNVIHMLYMFANSKFNQDISNWNMSNVEDIAHMFENSQFMHDISKWNLTNIERYDNAFKNCHIENKNKPKILQQ